VLSDGSSSFERDIRPLFREEDRVEMEAWFDLWSLSDVREHAVDILERLQDGSMPCDEAWSDDLIETFNGWIQAGMPE
jgi:hypothetical protein